MHGTAALVFALCALLGGRAPGAQTAADALPGDAVGGTLAVGPYLPAPEIRQRFGPLAQYLGEALGRSIAVEVAGTPDMHEDAVGRDASDIAYLDPVSYVAVVERFGPKPILAQLEAGGKPYVDEVVVVRRGSPVQGLADLKGKRLAFGADGSTTVPVLARYALRQSGLGVDALGGFAALPSHYDVVMRVLDGGVDAGVVPREVFDAMASRGLRVVAALAPASQGVLVARANLPQAEVRRLRRALLQLPRSADGQRILQAISDETTGMRRANDADFAQLRKLLRENDGG
jgi:phosphonate transport system substrate-binding protein